MPPAHRLGDSNSGGGVIDTIPQSTVFANDRLLAVDGSLGTGHPFGPPHDPHVWQTAGGSPTVFAHDIPVNYEGNPDTCGHVRVAGSADVFVN